MILVDFEPEPILINYEEKEMPKTVTVEVEIPEGYELAEPKMRPPKEGEFYSYAGDAHRAGFNFAGECHPILRPIPAEQTWERPEWLHPQWKQLRWMNHCWYLSRDGIDWVALADIEFLSDAAMRRLPSEVCLVPPAARIWRIVERGEG